MLKKLITIGSFVVVSSLALAGTLKVGASPVPHAELLNFVKADLQKQGVDLKIVEFTDYVTPNLALSDGELDANFFQHLPYLQKFASERNLKLSAAGKVHVEPIGLYSKKATSLKNLKKGATIAIPNDPSNGGRALILLHNKKLLVLKDPKNLYTTEFDIIKNPNNFKFKAVEAAQLPRVLSDVDAALINGNYDGKTVVLGIRPEDVHDSQAFISNSPDSIIESEIKVYELLGAEVFLYFDVEGTQMTARVNPRTTLRTGDKAVFALDMEKIHVFDKETELTITN